MLELFTVPKMKIFIYALTFLGYAYTGYGADIISQLRDAVIAAETVFGDFLDNFITVAKKFQGVTEVLNAAVDEDCVYSCPNGEKASPNKFHKPASNGCGPVGMEIPTDALPAQEMTECCNQHDLCYDTCNSDKGKCDFELGRCLNKICERKSASTGDSMTKVCKTFAKTMFGGTITLGCKSYLDAQKEACYCPLSRSKKSNYHKGEL